MRQTDHEKFMLECIRLADKGKGFVSPNPRVGAVLIRRNKIIARGYHYRFGGAHAEVDCLQKVKGDVSDTTLYVNLEPCSHFGKTPPCTDLILERGIKRVVVAMKDPNPLVSGKGIRKLRATGVKVEVGVCEDEARMQNRFFIKHIKTKTPFVHMKIAETFDGFIARRRGKIEYITSKESLELVHQWRAEYDAVLVGAGTILADNPRLDVRLVRGRNPDVVVLDGNLSVSGDERVFSTASKRRVFCCVKKSAAETQSEKINSMRQKGVIVLEFKTQAAQLNLKSVLRKLCTFNIGSVLVEGGANVFEQFVLQRLVDEYSFFMAPRHFEAGIKGLTHEASVRAGEFLIENEFQVYTVGRDALTKSIRIPR